MTEILDDSQCLFAEPDSEDQWAQAMRRLVDDPKLRSELAANAFERVSDLTWEKTAARLVAIGERAALQGSNKTAPEPVRS